MTPHISGTLGSMRLLARAVALPLNSVTFHTGGHYHRTECKYLSRLIKLLGTNSYL
jgi:hypothetical protein